MSFDYEKSIWGRGMASTRISDPRSFRLRKALFAIRELKAGDRVLEIGAGAGQFIRAIKKIRPELDCYGSDISINAIGVASETNDGVNYVLQGSGQLPFEKESFSAILVFDVLEHVENPEQLVGEMRRILRPGGRLYAFVPCEGDTLSFWHTLRTIGVGNDLTKKYAGHIQYFSRWSLRGLFEKCGFQIEKIVYSEHILGQLLGIFAFWAMGKAATGKEQINNEEYFSKNSGLVVISLKKIVNSLVFIESLLLQKIPSPNVHILLKKALS